MAWKPRRLLRVLGAVACALPAIAQGAESSSEAWPELQVFIRLNETTQLLLNPAPTRSRETDDRTGVDYGIYLDQRRRGAPGSYRIGYVRSLSDPSGSSFDAAENRIVLDYTHRWRPAQAVLLTDRTRLDLRNKEGTSSQRLRNRVQLEYETRLAALPVVPYANLEIYYDTRYDAFARLRAEAGATFVFSESADLTLYLARQTDTRPQRSSVNALGTTLALHF